MLGDGLMLLLCSKLSHRCWQHLGSQKHPSLRTFNTELQKVICYEIFHVACIIHVACPECSCQGLEEHFWPRNAARAINTRNPSLQGKLCYFACLCSLGCVKLRPHLSKALSKWTKL